MKDRFYGKSVHIDEGLGHLLCDSGPRSALCSPGNVGYIQAAKTLATSSNVTTPIVRRHLPCRQLRVSPGDFSQEWKLYAPLNYVINIHAIDFQLQRRQALIVTDRSSTTTMTSSLRSVTSKESVVNVRYVTSWHDDVISSCGFVIFYEPVGELKNRSRVNLFVTSPQVLRCSTSAFHYPIT